MILVGDIAVPQPMHTKQLKDVFDKYPDVFNKKLLICNFEGLLISEIDLKKNEPVLYNHPELLNVLKSRGDAVACLANNHILDLPDRFTETISAFNKSGIYYGGAGTNFEEAKSPIRITIDGIETIIFNACWDFLLYNQKNPTRGVHIAEINAIRLIQEVETTRKINPASSIIVYLHWNFDLETLPFPMHRQFAKKLIDVGADLVVGSHSHCVQGGEKYKNGYIVYGLGNFFIPNNVFAQGKISYPGFAKTELALEWDNKNNTAICHWFVYQIEGENHLLKHTGSEDFETSSNLKSYSPFQGMTDAEYLIYFRKNRRKKKLIPVYKDFQNTTVNRIFTYYLKQRALLARFLAKHNFIKWQN